MIRTNENVILSRILKNSGYLFSATGISAALNMLQSILTARILGVEGVGLLGTIIMFTSVINKFASFRMSELVIRYIGQFSEAGDTRKAAAVFKSAAMAEMLVSLVAFGLVWGLSPLAAVHLGKDPATSGSFALYGTIILANLIAESATGLLQVFDRYRSMASLTVAQNLFTLAAVAVIYFTGGGLALVLLAYVGGKMIGALGLTGAALVEARRRWGPGWLGTPLSLLLPQARELAHFGVSTNISASLSLINKDSELLWISFFRSPVESGFYKTAWSIVNLVQLPISPLPQATYPELARAVARRDWTAVRLVLRRGSWLAGGFTLAVALFLLLLGRPLISLLYGPEFLPAYPALLILLAGFLVANTFYWHRTALLSLGRPDFPTKVNLALAILKVVGILLLVPRYGYLANAALLAGSYILGVGVSTLKVRELLPRAEAPANA